MWFVVFGGYSGWAQLIYKSPCVGSEKADLPDQLRTSFIFERPTDGWGKRSEVVSKPKS